MFGDLEGLERVRVTKEEIEEGVIDCFTETRSDSWFITYTVYEDKCVVVEAMDNNYEHCIQTCKNLDEAIYVASRWR